MQNDLRTEYKKIGEERDAMGRVVDRERFWFFVRVACIAWTWVIIGGAIMAQAFHIQAAVGQFYFPRLMDKADAYLKAGLLIGTAGPLGTLIIGWRKATQRGYLD